VLPFVVPVIPPLKFVVPVTVNPPFAVKSPVTVVAGVNVIIGVPTAAVQFIVRFADASVENDA
jgi:hypothetical protein